MVSVLKSARYCCTLAVLYPAAAAFSKPPFTGGNEAALFNQGRVDLHDDGHGSVRVDDAPASASFSSGRQEQRGVVHGKKGHLAGAGALLARSFPASWKPSTGALKASAMAAKTSTRFRYDFMIVSCCCVYGAGALGPR
jgi:hypothetical protein